MKPTILLLISVSIMALFSCKSSYTPEAYKKEQIRFGSGGGFTGAVTEYCLLASGHVYLKEHGDTTFHQVNKISKAEAKTIFTEAVEKNIPTHTMKEPYNMYKFITYKTADESNHLVWGIDGATQKKGSAEISAFHAKLMAIINPVE